ncbi:MAG: translation elongation factor Ts [Deltaproteobacteria bacterium]|nr:translation elongation factor Ts [Deltaproteobacteria bacterium]MBW1953223.1 translation elongation factor Ts [Deltaproteobacteria bacterium]MBW1985683.1 translation elongation factor Ts [Deltaproteobacteria bacterium]MBW2134596.1 translation elongation factor Ts [Deltaproteobacteria bacterium]
MQITAEKIKELRDKTNAGMMDCKKALTETQGDMDQAVVLLRQKGLAIAQKRSGRATSEGLIHAYIHFGGKIGVLVEVNCETDFVAKTPAFQEFVKNLAMQIAATNPLCLRPEEIPPEVLEKEKAIFRAQALESGKPENVIDRIVEGRLKKFYSEACLLEQPYVKNPDILIQDYLNEIIAQVGENVTIRRFTRYQLGAD